MRDMREMGDLLKEKERYPLYIMIKFGTTKFEVNYFFKMYTCCIIISQEYPVISNNGTYKQSEILINSMQVNSYYLL